MFNNIGDKLKSAAVITFILNCVGFFIGGIICFTNDAVGFGFLCMFGGIIAAWVLALILYGFGQLIENSAIVAKNYKKKRDNQAEKTEKRETKQVKTSIENTNVDGEPLIAVHCPSCGKMISISKNTFQNSDKLPCPYCNTEINTEKHKK